MKAAVLEALAELVSDRAQARESDPPPPRSARASVLAPSSPAAARQSFTRHALRVLEDHELTPQEVKIAVAVLQGQTNEQIAEAAELSIKTVKHHIGAVFRKFHVDSRAQLSARIFPV